MKEFLSKNIFETKYSSSNLSTNKFIGAISMFIIYGLSITAIMSKFFAPEAPSFWYMIIVGLLLPIIGTILNNSSNNQYISFIGYNLIVAPIGLCLGPMLNGISSNIIINSMLITAIITIVMCVFGVIFSNSFKRIGNILFYSLIGLISVRLLGTFIPYIQSLSIIDYIAATIFSLYIGYDIYRATKICKTYKNALQVSISIYLDIINLFITLISIISKGRNV